MQKEEQDINKEYLDSLLCPSFNSYTTDQLAGIADQVGRDHKRTQNDDAFTVLQNDDTDFEFAAFQDEGFFDDVVFPLFNRDLLREPRSSVSGGRDSSFAVLRFPIAGGEVGRRERAPSSESSSEADELERVPAGTYCVWTPNSPQASPSKCKKSNSTGSSSSKKWKLLDLLRRSNSEGKESFMFLTASSEKKKVKEQWSIEVAGKSKTKGFSGEKKVAVSAHEALYVRNRELKRLDKKRSFLPYRPDLVGFYTGRLGKAFPSF
ncbi:hypothetical protein VNO77_20136 [Canavalia gladiata]|uniref:Uncharacterized protein n=1 Tax=Canavalia gladiata TaxID=3824 RepID=A0AAN9LNS5_CANGL